MPREVETQDAEWWRRGTRDTVPPAEVGAHGPIAQGSTWITSDALLEIEQ